MGTKEILEQDVEDAVARNKEITDADPRFVATDAVEEASFVLANVDDGRQIVLPTKVFLDDFTDAVCSDLDAFETWVQEIGKEQLQHDDKVLRMIVDLAHNDEAIADALVILATELERTQKQVALLTTSVRLLLAEV